MKPREHGAYGQLFAPLAAALLGGRPTVAGTCLAAAFVCAFFAHEPWLVLSGQRGTRTEKALASAAKQRLVLLGVGAAALGSVGLIFASHATRLACVMISPLTLVAILLSHFEKLRTAFGEVWASTVMASLGVPVSLACGAPLALAIANALAWSLAFVAGVYAVRALIERKKTGSRGRGLWGIVAVVALSIVEWRFHSGPVLAVAPLIVAAVILFAWAPSPKLLRKVGWALVTFTAVSSLGMALNTRARTSSIEAPSANRNGVCLRRLATKAGWAHRPIINKV